MGNQNFIEINGRRYDTISGKLIHDAVSAQSSVVPTKTVPRKNSGVMDGVAKRPTRSNTHSPATNLHKSPQKSQTLMRSVVHKPSEPLLQQAKKASTIQKSHLGVSARRLSQANLAQKSTQIRKFSPSSSRTSVIRTHSEAQVRTEPVHATSSVASSRARSSSSSDTAVEHPTRKVSVTEKLINAALATSRSHEELPVHFKRRGKLSRKLGVSSRAASVSMAVLAGVLLGGFFAVQNVPNLAMKVAATRAGFNANMPGYNPSGFSFRGPINYTAGKVTVSYRSNTDDRNYSVSQSSSNWNSDALLSNFVVANNKTYQTYLDRGRTLYMYDGSSATWIDDGIWYQIEGESSLTTDQLIRIAASL